MILQFIQSWASSLQLDATVTPTIAQRCILSSSASRLTEADVLIIGADVNKT